MSAAIKAGVHCTACDSDHILQLNGELYCLNCGEQFGTDLDKQLPAIVADLLRVTVQDCCFRYDTGYVFDNTPKGEYSLRSQINSRNNTCKIQFELVSPDAPRNRDETVYYEPGHAGNIPPEIVSLLRVAREKGLRVTAMPKSDQGKYRWARLEGYFLANPGEVLKGFFEGGVFSLLVRVRMEAHWVNPNYEELPAS